MITSKDTIYALSSGKLPAGVAVVRLSGPKAIMIATTMTGLTNYLSRKAYLRSIHNRNNELIDQGLVLIFQGTASFTGEDCVELQVHGSLAVISALFAEFNAYEDVRHAEAGEFTKRAFDNGKIDLLEAEGLADLLSAETEMQRRLAIEQSSGNLSALYESWAGQLTKSRALIEAELDFADEEDVPGSVSEQVWARLSLLRNEISDHLNNGNSSELVRDGFKVALVGLPNSGKSTLMNKLTGREVSIVTDIAGTTRDVLSAELNLNGYLVKLYDTAGLRATDDIVEAEGVKRAISTAKEADLLIYLHTLDSDTKLLQNELNDLSYIIINNKSDVFDYLNDDNLSISSMNGSGLDKLKELIFNSIEMRIGTTNSLMPSRERHKKRLLESLHYIDDAINSDGYELAIRSEYLRLAAFSLGRITGRVDVEDLLGVIFSEFCIGK